MKVAFGTCAATAVIAVAGMIMACSASQTGPGTEAAVEVPEEEPQPVSSVEDPADLFPAIEKERERLKMALEKGPMTLKDLETANLKRQVSDAQKKMKELEQETRRKWREYLYRHRDDKEELEQFYEPKLKEMFRDLEELLDRLQERSRDDSA